MTRSGRADEIRTSGGMISPLSDLPGKSLMMLAICLRPPMHISIWVKTQLRLHVCRP